MSHDFMLADLRSSGLTDDTIAEMGCYPVEGGRAGLKGLIGFSSMDGQSIPQAVKLYAFPYPGGGVRVKLVPSLNGAKYLSPKGEGAKNLYYLNADKDKIQKKPKQIIITEGEKKTALLSQTLEGTETLAVGLSGVWNFEEITFDGLTLKDREIYLALDADFREKSDVQLALASLSLLLLRAKATVKILTWDGTKGKGIDDYLAAFPVEERKAELERLMAGAEQNPFAVLDKVDAEAFARQAVKHQISRKKALAIIRKYHVQKSMNTPIQDFTTYLAAEEGEKVNEALGIETDTWGRGDFLRSIHYRKFFEKAGWTFSVCDLDDRLFVNGKEMDDYTMAQVKAGVLDFHFSANWGHAEAALLSDAGQHRFHPVKDFFASLPAWDGQDWLSRLCAFVQAEPTFRRYLEIWLAGAVHRVRTGEFNPVLCLYSDFREGKDGQGIGKSCFAQWLASPMPEFFRAGGINPDDKDDAIALTRTWIWEIEELGSVTRRKDVEALKSFLTRPIVEERKAYGHNPIRKPPLASFIATANGDAFLVDTSGNRRFHSVRVVSFDWARYPKEIDACQLWAQAVHLADEKRYLLSPEEQIKRDATNEERRIQDPVESILDACVEVVPADKRDELKARKNGYGLPVSVPFLSSMAISDKLREHGIQPNRGAMLAVAAWMKAHGAISDRGETENASGEKQRCRGYTWAKLLS